MTVRADLRVHPWYCNHTGKGARTGAPLHSYSFAPILPAIRDRIYAIESKVFALNPSFAKGGRQDSPETDRGSRISDKSCENRYARSTTHTSSRFSLEFDISSST